MSEQAPLTPSQPNPDQNTQIPDQSVDSLGENIDRLLDPSDDLADNTIEGAAVRPEPTAPTAAQEAERQSGISAADRQIREEAGLPPPTADLR